MLNMNRNNAITTAPVFAHPEADDIRVPRYTSYPTAGLFAPFDDEDLMAQTVIPEGSAALYVHIPFCDDLCFYCACNKVVTRHHDKADRYLDYLHKEMVQRHRLLKDCQITQLHIGGGSPGFLSVSQQARLRAMLDDYFCIDTQAELSIELDPRHTSRAYLAWLVQLGYNRISFGVQDTDVQVQQAINRVQSTRHIHELVSIAKSLGVASVNLDLIYGLPHQNLTSFSTTLADVIAMQADRISLFSYAHMPARFAAQRRIHTHWLPDARTRTQLNEMAIANLLEAGYSMIGMDHFARKDDALARANRQQTVHRNFMGYTTEPTKTLLGLGMSAISSTPDVYSQNPGELNAYYARLDAQCGLTAKGYVLNQDDKLRRDVIMHLMCHLHIEFASFNATHKIDFVDYFASELSALMPFIDVDLITLDEDKLQVYPSAKRYIRTICSIFDGHQPVLNHRLHECRLEDRII